MWSVLQAGQPAGRAHRRQNASQLGVMASTTPEDYWNVYIYIYIELSKGSGFRAWSALQVAQLAGETQRQKDDGARLRRRCVQRVVDEPGDIGAEKPVVAAVAVQVEDRHRAVAEPARAMEAERLQ